jgi:hypothetical protein
VPNISDETQGDQMDICFNLLKDEASVCHVSVAVTSSYAKFFVECSSFIGLPRCCLAFLIINMDPRVLYVGTFHRGIITSNNG